MAASVGLVVHSTESDAEALARLGASLRRFNIDRLPVTVQPVIPGARVLDLWRTADADVVVSLMPEVEFIRDFAARDFLTADGVPYTVVSEEAERRVEGIDPALDDARRSVLREVGIADPRLLVSRGLVVLSTGVLRSFAEDFLAPRGWDSAHALAICADEYAWYTAWLRASGVVPFEMHEPMLAALDTPGSRSDHAMNGTTAADLARGYVGVLWPERPLDGDPRSPSAAMAAGLTAGELASATVRRVTRKAPRVQRWFHLH